MSGKSYAQQRAEDALAAKARTQKLHWLQELEAKADALSSVIEPEASFQDIQDSDEEVIDPETLAELARLGIRMRGVA